MKIRAYLATSAIIFASFVPVFNAAALADTIPTPTADAADGTTLGEMQNQCDLLAAAHDTANGDAWTGVFVEGAVTLVSGPTEVGAHSIADAIPGTLVGTGTFTPAHVQVLGDPYRNGGSVNMFGVLQSVGGHYSSSTYDYVADFTTTFAHAFSCNIFQAVFHAEQTIHHNAEGKYVIAGDFGASEDAVRGNCAAFTAQGDNDPRPDWWGEPFHGGNPDNPHCMFDGTPASDEVIPESFDEPVLIGNEAGTPVNQEQTDTLTAHEDAGEGFDISDTVLIGQAVICISPSTTVKKGVPGAWRTQNGYTGTKCTTAWFNVAPWGHGSQDSNGTYISVPIA
jgi:hypothetical protein